MLRILCRFVGHRQIQDGERELRVICGQTLRLLPQQPTLEALDLLLQNESELLVLVPLALELLDAKRVCSFEGAEALFECCCYRVAHQERMQNPAIAVKPCVLTSVAFSCARPWVRP